MIPEWIPLIGIIALIGVLILTEIYDIGAEVGFWLFIAFLAASAAFFVIVFILMFLVTLQKQFS